MKVLHILPNVPPAVCGIGDYSWGIARQMREKHGVDSVFLAAGTSRGEPKQETEFPVFRLPYLTPHALVDFISSRRIQVDVILLHMSAYGFHARGVPVWLAQGWRRLSLLPGCPAMLTMFHELHASGPPNTSAFWLQPLQKWVLRIIARASDGLRTNREAYAEWLRGVPGLKTSEVAVMPVYSNFKEPEVIPAWAQRDAAMAMFAWGIHSGESLGAVVERASACCRRFGLGRLHLIGSKGTLERDSRQPEIVHHGFLEPEIISQLLLSCRMAYSAYSPDHFGKSTLVAAFAAHGLTLITQGRRPVLADGLRDLVNVLNEESLAEMDQKAEADLENIGRSLQSWYAPHSLSENAADYARQTSFLVEAHVKKRLARRETDKGQARASV